MIKVEDFPMKQSETTPITYNSIYDTIKTYKDDKYIVLIGYTGLYDNCEKALPLNKILNTMFEKGYKFIQYQRNPLWSGLVSNVEFIFEKID